MKNGMKWLGTAAILFLAACKDKDPLAEVRPKIVIKCSFQSEEAGREAAGHGTEKIYLQTYLSGTITNNSDKDLTDVVLAVANSKSDSGDGFQYVNVGDLPAGESRDIYEFYMEGGYVGGRVPDPSIKLSSATVAGAKP